LVEVVQAQGAGGELEDLVLLVGEDVQGVGVGGHEVVLVADGDCAQEVVQGAHYALVGVEVAAGGLDDDAVNVGAQADNLEISSFELIPRDSEPSCKIILLNIGPGRH